MAEEGPAGREDPLTDGRLPVGPGKRRVDLPDDDVDHPVEQLVLVGDVLVQGHRDDAELFGQVAHAERLDTTVIGQGQGGPEHPVSGQGLPGRRLGLRLRRHPFLLRGDLTSVRRTPRVRQEGVRRIPDRPGGPPGCRGPPRLERRDTMKAIVQDRYGSADGLEFRDIEEPVVGKDEVLVRVRASGCGPDVWHIMTGQPYFARLMLGFRRPKVGVRGWDVAGTVEAVGSSVDGFRPGDEVMGLASGGSFAELAMAPADKLVHKPGRLTFEEAAAVPISGVTALRAIREVGKVQPGQTVLVIGAAGGVGTLTVQIAKAFGAQVTGVSSTSKMDLVR